MNVHDLHNLSIIDLMKNIALIAAPLTIYLAWTKIGKKVGAYYTWGGDRITADGIRRVTLINLKDKSLVVCSIHAVLDNMSIPLKDFNPPLIIKGLEAVGVDIEPASGYHVGGEKFEFTVPFVSEAKFDLYVSTVSGDILCKRKYPSGVHSFSLKNKTNIVSPVRMKFNDRIYSEKVAYAIVYTYGGIEKTAFIDNHGWIDWGMRPNFLPPDQTRSCESIEMAIRRHEIAPSIEPFCVKRLPPA